MNRTRDYRRYIRNKHIARRKRIVENYYGFSWYEHDGMYSKGKIHCSCAMCAFRGYNKNQITHSDKRKIKSMEIDLTLEKIA